MGARHARRVRLTGEDVNLQRLGLGFSDCCQRGGEREDGDDGVFDDHIKDRFG